MNLKKVTILVMSVVILTIIAACSAATPETVVEKVVETVVVEKEVEVEGKTVVETVVVEKEVVVEVPAAGAAQELKVAGAFFAGAQGGDLAALDPARRGVWGFHSLLWAPLIWGDAAGNIDFNKSLAESYEVNDDNTVYTFKLREDALYSDGEPITAEDVVLDWGYYAMMNHNEARGYRDNFGVGRRLYPDIVGFMEFADNVPYDQFGVGKVGDVEGVKALDDNTIEITLKAPSSNFIKRLAGTFAAFKPEDVEAGKDTEYDLLDYWPAYAASSGPYKIVEAVPGERYVLEPNENYFGPKPELSKITVLSVSEDPNTIITAFANQELDMVAIDLTGDVARQTLDDPYLNRARIEVPDWNVFQFWITPNPPLDDIHVRRAFSMAFNRDAMINILNAGSEIPLFRSVNMHRNPGVPHCQEETAAVTMLPYDPEAARAELEQSEYWPEVLDMEINILVGNPFAGTPDLVQAEALQKMLQDNLGLTNVKIHTEEVPDMNNPPFPLHLWHNAQQPWYADITDTLKNMTFLMKDEPWKPEDPRPFVTVAYEPELRALVEEAIAEQDPGKRCELVAEAGQLWNDVAFSLDYGRPASYYLIAPWVEGELQWYENARQGKPLNIEDWWVSERR